MARGKKYRPEEIIRKLREAEALISQGKTQELAAKQAYCPSNWCSNTRGSECSVFTIGRRMLRELDVPIQQIINGLVQATCNAAPNWG